MYDKTNGKIAEKCGNPDIWLSVDPLKVKQRIDRITQQLEAVRRSLEPKIKSNKSDLEKN